MHICRFDFQAGIFVLFDSDLRAVLHVGDRIMGQFLDRPKLDRSARIAWRNQLVDYVSTKFRDQRQPSTGLVHEGRRRVDRLLFNLRVRRLNRVCSGQLCESPGRTSKRTPNACYCWTFWRTAVWTTIRSHIQSKEARVRQRLRYRVRRFRGSAQQSSCSIVRRHSIVSCPAFESDDIESFVDRTRASSAPGRNQFRIVVVDSTFGRCDQHYRWHDRSYIGRRSNQRNATDCSQSDAQFRNRAQSTNSCIRQCFDRRCDETSRQRISATRLSQQRIVVC